MDRLASVREPRTYGCAGDGPTTPSGRGGESPSFFNSLTFAQIAALIEFVNEHGFWAHLIPDHSVTERATWSVDLTTVHELELTCSCGITRTFDLHGEEVITHG